MGRNFFKGTIVQQDSKKNKGPSAEEIAKLKRIETEKDKEIEKLQQLCEKFNVKNFRRKLSEALSKTLEDVEMQQREFYDKESIILKFIDKLI